jgi:hypothetical protein
MASPAAGWPRTALTVTRVSRMQGRPLILFGSMEVRSYATPEAYVTDPQPQGAPHLPRPSPSARRSTANTSTGARAPAEYQRRCNCVGSARGREMMILTPRLLSFKTWQ